MINKGLKISQTQDLSLIDNKKNDIIDSRTTIIKRVLKRILKLLSLTDSNDSENLKGFKKAFVIMLGILVFYFNYFKFLVWVNDVINK